MEARDGTFTPLDYIKIVLRKFFRLAIPYYFFWLLLWCLNSRVFNGPIWHNSNARYETCKDQWWPTALFIGNLVPEDMYPYGDCYQQAFPLQVDMQLTLFVPLIAMLAYKHGSLASFLCVAFIIGNIFISMFYANKYDLVIGMLNVRNFSLLTGVIAKPWLHLQNIGFGVGMGMFYWEILAYRKMQVAEEREQKYPIISKIHASPAIGAACNGIGNLIIMANLFAPYTCTVDPMSSSRTANAVYYGLSRPSWVLGVFLVLIAIFTGHFQFAKGILSGGNFRYMAKATPICTLVLIIIIDGIFESDQMQSGLDLTFSTCLIYGLGFALTAYIIGCLLLLLFEFPLRRLYQFTLLPLLSHDKLLANWHYKTVMSKRGLRIKDKDVNGDSLASPKFSNADGSMSAEQMLNQQQFLRRNSLS